MKWICIYMYVCVKFKDGKRSLSGKNDHIVLWHYKNSYNTKFRVVTVFKQLQRVVVCEDMPWCESHVVAVKENGHNKFGLHENTTNRWRSGLSANGHLLYVRCPILIGEQQWPQICKQNNTKLGWYVARNEACAWKAETFSKSRIVERSNQDVRDMLVAWLSDNNTKTWSEGLRFIRSKKHKSGVSGS